MSEVITLSIPLDAPLKEAEKERFTNGIITSFGKIGIDSAKIVDSYYEEQRAAPTFFDFVMVINLAANLFTIALGIREFLKKEKKIKHAHLKTDSLSLYVEGNMSEETLLKLIKEGRRVVEKKK